MIKNLCLQKRKYFFMNRKNVLRYIIPNKIPKRLWLSKEYRYIILYALEVYGPIYQQEFVNRPGITDKIPEKTFYNHIKKLKKDSYIIFEIYSIRRRKKYNITPEGENALKIYLRENQAKYGDLYLKLENIKYFEKKRVFSDYFQRYLDLCKRISKKFIDKLVDLSHFYSSKKFIEYIELDNRLKNEKIFKKNVTVVFTKFMKLLNNYRKIIELDLLESEKEIFYNEEIDNYEFNCPRCKGKKIIDYGKTFECILCRLEFDKISFKLIDDENILANQEKKKIIDILKEPSVKDESKNN